MSAQRAEDNESSRFAHVASGNDPSSTNAGSTPGSFARPPGIGTPYTFSSPDTPGMPEPSGLTAWDFMPPDWQMTDGLPVPPSGFEAVTQLEHARLGRVTPEMRRVAEREAHLTEEQVREEIAAGRLLITANRIHLSYNLEPMAGMGGPLGC